MKVDIIIPAYHGTYLEDAIYSCKNQSYQNIEITVIDNQSPKDIEKICQKFSKINYIKSSENKGPAGGRNLGIKFTSGDLISFLDDDDLMTKEKIALAVQEFKKHPEIGMVCGNYQLLIDRKSLRPPFYKKSQNINWNTLMNQNLVASGSVTIKRDVVKQIGLFNEEYWIAEDYDYWIRISEKYPINYLPQVLYYYSWINKSDSSLTKRADIQANHDKNLAKIKKDSRLRMGI